MGCFGVVKSSSLRAFVEQRAPVASSVKEAARYEPTRIDVIARREHRPALDEALADAQVFVGISSGWLGSVVDGALISSIRDALRLGIEVHICFGNESGAGVHQRMRSGVRAETELDRLAASAVGDSRPGSLWLTRIPTHEKRIIVDDKCIVVGSNNWLSSLDSRNSEGSYPIHSRALVATERQVMTALREDRAAG